MEKLQQSKTNTVTGIGNKKGNIYLRLDFIIILIRLQGA